MVIKGINPIEISSLCNKQCVYCPSKNVASHRPTGIMTMPIFEKCIDIMRTLPYTGGINLHGMGEPLMNPHIIDMVQYAKHRLRNDIHICTNGLWFDDRLARELKYVGLDYLDVTDHDPIITARVNKICSEHGINGVVSDAFRNMTHSWAGLIPLPHDEKWGGCKALSDGIVTVLWNGDITRCCIDANGVGVMGNILDGLEGLETGKFELCEKCHLN